MKEYPLDVLGRVNPAQIMNKEKKATRGMDRVTRGRPSVIKKMEFIGFFLGIQFPVNKSKPS